MAKTSTQTIALEPVKKPIELERNSSNAATDTESQDQRQDNGNTPPENGRETSFEPTNPDTILALSLLADASVPDGGYGWIICLSCSILTFWFVGTTYSWGILQAALVKEGLAAPSTVSFVGSLTCACISFLALVNARVIRGVGGRVTAFCGVCFLGVGGILSGFTTKSVGGLFFTAGCVMGLGASLLFMVVSTIPAQYFSKKRGIANGIVYAGGGFGGATLSFAMDALIQRLGPAWTFRIVGILTLVTGLPAAWLIRERAPITGSVFVEWSLFKNLRFSTLFLAGAIGTFPLFVPPFFLPLYSNSVGLSTSTGAGLVAGFNFSSAVGRLLCGFLSDYMGPVNTLLLSLVLSALSMLVIWPVSTSLGPLVAFVIVNGAANGGFFSTMPTVVGSVFGSRRVGVAMGMIVTGWAGGYLMGAPIAGYLLAAYGGEHGSLKAYHPAIFYAGSMALAAAGLVAALRVMMSKRVWEKM